jgi:hypothetical protein
MVDEYIWDRTGGAKRGIIIRGQVFSCTADRAGFSQCPLDTGQIAPDFPDARLIQVSAGVQHNLWSQVSGALFLTPGDDQDG